MDSEFKVAVLGCSGIGRLVSTIVRQALYMLQKDRPDNVILVSSGSLTGDVPEALETARKYPLIVIDGCRPRCASAIAAGKGLQPAATVWVAEVAAQAKMSLAGENRKGLSEKGMALARKLADETLKKIDLIIAEEMMSTL
ncbi:MAG: putative zinc-binding protein [Armatimonadota bacterium]